MCLFATSRAVVTLFNIFECPVIFLLYFVFVSVVVAENAISKDESCKQCQFLARTFVEGLKITQNSHFGGGNTDWEERNLGKFRFSSTCFLETLDYICKKETLKNSYDFDSKDLQYKCHALAEEHEDILENWFNEREETGLGLEQFFCVDELKRCCRDGHFGAECQPCPGLRLLAGDGKVETMVERAACYGRGTCGGSGTRKGTGKCDCDVGYVGVMCSSCDAHYYPVAQNATYIECDECFDGCASGCTAAGPKSCLACRSGYVMDKEAGCKDVDECAEGGDGLSKCTGDHERCVNTVGSFHCGCEDGYKRAADRDSPCELDVEASPPGGWLPPPDVTLRMFAIVGLTLIAAFVLLFYRSASPLLVVLTVLAVGVAFLIDYFYEQIVPAEMRKMLQDSLTPNHIPRR